MSRPGDKLLAVVSARQRMTWSAFRDAFDFLHLQAVNSGNGIEPVAYVRHRSLRLLSELGHCEVAALGPTTYIYAASTVLARLPHAGLPLAVACGSRGLESVLRLRAVCAPLGHDARVIVASQPSSGGYAPLAIRIEVTDEVVLELVAKRAGLHLAATPPAWRLLRYSASIENYQAQLVWTSEQDPRWPRRDFAADSLTFSLVHAEGHSRLSSFKDPVTRRQIHRLWHNGRSAMTDRDWGRWLYLNHTGQSVLLFDGNAQRVAVPVTVSLPILLGRALTLFSGLVPHRRPHPVEPTLLIDVYSGVSREAAEFLAVKLKQKLSPIDLS